MTWILLVTWVGYGLYPQMQSVAGFRTEYACLHAGALLVEKDYRFKITCVKDQ